MFLCTGSLTWYIKIKHQNNIIINKLMSINIMSKIQDITMVVFMCICALEGQLGEEISIVLAFGLEVYAVPRSGNHL